jgi:hypothetical protein
MTYSDFEQLVQLATEELIVSNAKLSICKHFLAERVRDLLACKHGEYALDADALSNFKNGGSFFGEAPEKVLLFYKLKHDLSIKKLVDELPKINKKLFLEKIGDDMAYLVLLYALLSEREES